MSKIRETFYRILGKNKIDDSLKEIIIMGTEALGDAFTPEGPFRDLPIPTFIIHFVGLVRGVTDAYNRGVIISAVKEKETGALSEKTRKKLETCIKRLGPEKLLQQLDIIYDLVTADEKSYKETVKYAVSQYTLYNESDKLSISEIQGLFSVIDSVQKADLEFVFTREVPLKKDTTGTYSILKNYFSDLSKKGLIEFSEGTPGKDSISFNEKTEPTEYADIIYQSLEKYAPDFLPKKKKEKLVNKELLDHIGDHGVQFTVRTKENISEYLETENYYFRVAAYRENWRGYDKSYIYKPPEFADLITLSKIDDLLRATILSTTCAIEQQLKIILLNHILHSEIEDGFDITESFLLYNESTINEKYKKIRNKIRRMNSGTYSRNLVLKYAFNDEFPVWALVETLSFGELVEFAKYYWKRRIKRAQKSYLPFPLVLPKNEERFFKLLDGARRLRNASAHNNCLINDLRDPPKGCGFVENYEVFPIVEEVQKISKQPDSSIRIEGNIADKTKNRFVRDFLCLLFVFYKILPTSKKSPIIDSWKKVSAEIDKALYTDSDRKGRTDLGKNDVIRSTYELLLAIFTYLNAHYYEVYLFDDEYDNLLTTKRK